MDVQELLEKSKAAATGHYVYKKLFMHGRGYIDKDRFANIGARNLVTVLEETAEKAFKMGLSLEGHKEVVLLTPAYGAIKLGLPLAARLEDLTGVKVIHVETETERDDKGRRFHIIPENQKKMIMGLPIIGMEDIVNNGETFKELNKLALAELKSGLFAAICIIDRGGQSKQSLGIPYYYPYMRINMDQHDVRSGPCPQCAAGEPINTDLGKGAGWVAMFGQPPYPEGMDFSAYWAGKE